MSRHVGHFWCGKVKLMSDIFHWTPTYGHTRIYRWTKTYIHQLYADTRCLRDDLPHEMSDRDGLRKREWQFNGDRERERERQKGDSVFSSSWWWWWWWYEKVNEKHTENIIKSDGDYRRKMVHVWTFVFTSSGRTSSNDYIGVMKENAQIKKKKKKIWYIQVTCEWVKMAEDKENQS